MPDKSLVKVVSPAPEERWQWIYDTDNNALPSLSPVWGKALVESGTHKDASRLYEFSDGTSAVMPLFSRNLPFGSYFQRTSPPQAWGFGGLVSDTVLTAKHVKSVLDDLSTLPVGQISIRPNPLQVEIWREAAEGNWLAIPRRAHVLDLEGGIEHVRLKCFNSSGRRHLRQAQKANIEIASGNSPSLVSEFHSLLLLSFDRWAHQQGEPSALARWRGLRRDPESKFQALARTIGKMFQIWIARVNGEPAAAILVIGGHQAHYTRGAMNKDLAGPVAANYLLHSLAMEDACRRGCRYYHMGESGNSKSLSDFKEKFGAVPVDYLEFRHERLPISRTEALARSLVKRMVGMKGD